MGLYFVLLKLFCGSGSKGLFFGLGSINILISAHLVP